MGRSAILLALAGLALGLWLGFNPVTHREIVRWWERTSAGQSRERPSTGLSLHRLDRGLTQWFRTAPRPASPPAESNTAPTGRQIGATLQAFWQALQQLWLEFMLKLGIHPG